MPIIILCSHQGSEESEELLEIAPVQFNLTLYGLQAETDDSVHVLQDLSSACRCHSLESQALSRLLHHAVIELLFLREPLQDIEDEIIDCSLRFFPELDVALPGEGVIPLRQDLAVADEELDRKNGTFSGEREDMADYSSGRE